MNNPRKIQIGDKINGNKKKKKKGGGIARLLAKFCNRDCDAIGLRSLVATLKPIQLALFSGSFATSLFRMTIIIIYGRL